MNHLKKPVKRTAILRHVNGLFILLQSGKAVVLTIRITFKRIDSAILKLLLSCLKNNVACTYAINNRFTCPEIAVLFFWFFSNSSFFCADLGSNKGF